MTAPRSGRADFVRGPGIALASMLALFAAPGSAQVAGAPHYPTALSPSGGTLNARGGPRDIEWSQLFTTGPSVRPNPTYFVICFKPQPTNEPAPSCTPNDATWIESVGSPTTALTRDGSRFTFDPHRPLADDERDRQMRITVGACAGFACSHASAAVWYSSKDIFAGRPMSAPSSSSQWIIDVVADNLGSSAIGQYYGQLAYWEVLTEQPWAGHYTCAWNVDADVYRYDPTIWTIDERGNLLPISQLTRVDGRYTGIPIVGMMRIGAPYGQRTFVTGKTSIPPGEIVDVRVATVALPVPDSGRQRAYVLVARHDTTDVIREFEEINNARARCMTR